MHILTKVFVLFAAVLSVLMAALAVAYSVNAERIRSDYENALTAKAVSEAARDADLAASSQLQAALNTRIQELEGELATREARTRDLELKNSELTVGLRRAEAARQSIEGKIAQLGEALELNANLISSYKDQIARHQDSEIEYFNEKLDYLNAISDMESQLIVFEQRARALQVQLAAAQRELELFRNGAVAQGGDDDEVLRIPTLVRGSVTNVQNEAGTGQTLVQIDLGSSDGVRDNTLLYVHRGETYVGDIVVYRADVQSSLARFRPARGRQIEPGDSVVSSFN